jgi:hypothetical protein
MQFGQFALPACEADNVTKRMSIDKTADLTIVLAVYGALLSSITFGWNLLRDLSDRGKLKLELSIRKMTAPTGGRIYATLPSMTLEPVTEQLYLVLSVVNVGRRPMLWEGWGGKYFESVNGDTGFTIIGPNLPKMLNERESHREFTELVPGLMPNLKRLFIWDTSGKKWDVSYWQLWRLRREAKSLLAGARADAADPTHLDH